MYIIKILPLLIPQFAFTFIIGMLFFFYIRKRYIRLVVEAISGKEHADYYKVNKKIKVLGSIILSLVLVYAFLIVGFYQKLILLVSPDNKHLAVAMLLTIGGMAASFMGGAELSSWLVHDEDYREQNTKNK